MARNPVDLLIEFNQTISNSGDLDVPRRDCLVDDRCVRSPTVRVVVVVGIVPDDDSCLLQIRNDDWICIKNVLCFVVSDL
ncbi:unannotated protein [freshwater metagenome]|uniref:Unannotated protein n=1 Tax=freshwater metagenome TaxID=449393 RepID=A0A6J7GDP0_9ZZZZ